MSGLENKVTYGILEAAAVTAISGKRVVLLPGLVKLRSLSRSTQLMSADEVSYVNNSLQVDVLQGEFKRLLGSGKVKVV